jgi:hypothetical protein
MEPECRDRHQDDVDALRADLLKHADQYFAKLDAWLASRAKHAAIDAYRKRRAERGALQRPRMPVWLAQALGDDCWLRQLALNILEWVGVEATAGYDVWPLRAWVQQRANMVPGAVYTEAEMGAEVQHVLYTMRTRKPKWYAAHVERPLGYKQAPLAPAQLTDPEGFHEPAYVRYTGPDEQADALLTELARVALDRVGARYAAGTPLREAVAEAIGIVFGAGTGADGMDQAPGGGKDVSPMDLAAQLVLDPRVLDRVVIAVLEILTAQRAASCPSDTPETPTLWNATP